MKLKRAAALLLLASVAACYGPDIWTRPGATEADAARQQFACRMQAKTANPAGGLGQAIDFRVCMQVNGYADVSTPAGQAAAARRGF
jgi:hypothetical protein